MTLIATKERSQSDVIAYELFPEYGHCREVISMTGTATLTMGSVLGYISAAWVELANANDDALLQVLSNGTAAGVDKTPIAIVIDPLAAVGGLATSGTISVLCLVSGIAGVKKEFLSFTDANEAKVIAAIEANMGGVLVVDSQDPIA